MGKVKHFIKEQPVNPPKPKTNKFFIKTPFFMILGSLDLQRKDLQDHAEKHHCPSRYYKSKWGKLKTPF